MPNTATAAAVQELSSPFDVAFPHPAIGEWNQSLEKQTAIARAEWAMENLPGKFVLSSSFGIQSAVMLHLLTQVDSNIPVLITDTGHLF
ncbi:MAG: phosphoadenosine phosphosulfate reductase family protein, partial [Colwellia sp.]